VFFRKSDAVLQNNGKQLRKIQKQEEEHCNLMVTGKDFQTTP
jgi:hypothetical protein